MKWAGQTTHAQTKATSASTARVAADRRILDWLCLLDAVAWMAESRCTRQGHSRSVFAKHCAACAYSLESQRNLKNISTRVTFLLVAIKASIIFLVRSMPRAGP
ncbi:hypothetical protein F441_11654 [Phytophthora nicotianae CJ01A1]|uniref:Uncharacterized protein n=3 Tax=Phytophthora nicotianae TaxID=4792 RepID=V9EVI8_PHYNI|nr:hypothetical protein F443_11720 [Phytophthora nicotianae P1569]ETK83357.1 hypothetical protein L915_11410 [Phytophthora nicotianae]ETL36755.1 hypothetical protein L916_11315 [Phytophthora nicotianae]ETP13072.1 hypothetical protein F441_11654 [Phytophthora nicotianae CJ01A1]